MSTSKSMGLVKNLAETGVNKPRGSRRTDGQERVGWYRLTSPHQACDAQRKG